jgi:hypothetical protein
MIMERDDIEVQFLLVLDSGDVYNKPNRGRVAPFGGRPHWQP